MPSCQSFDEKLRLSVQKLNNLCAEFSCGLFFTESFIPKNTPLKTNDEVQFWYAVTNLYALFFDCSPYVFRKHNQYDHYNYETYLSKTLLDILCDNNCLNQDEKLDIINFIYAINELRSCFCHNKPINTFEIAIIEKGLGKNNDKWAVLPHLSYHVEYNFNFTIGLQILEERTERVFKLFSQSIMNLSLIKTNNIIKEWSLSIAAWYFQSEDIKNRCLSNRYNVHNLNTLKYLQIREWRKKLSISNIKRRAVFKKETEDLYLRNWVHKLADSIFNSSTFAYPEVIMSQFYDDIL